MENKTVCTFSGKLFLITLFKMSFHAQFLTSSLPHFSFSIVGMCVLDS